MTPPNASLSTDVPTAADIPVDNPPRDPQAVVKRKPGRPRIHASPLAAKQAWRAANPEYAAGYERRQRKLAGRLKRIAAARGMTAEALLDEMERR